MEKRYQVFVSSTFSDLEAEREKVFSALMKMDCIPAGMELFPAADEEQFEFIKKVIDDSDYYVLIIGGRYGAVTATGISYTEREYDYAVSKGMKVLSFLHKSPAEISVGKSDTEPSTVQKLEAFRTKVSSGRLVNYWEKADELPGLVALSLPQTMKTHPAVGWVRGNVVANETMLLEINELRKANTALTGTVAEFNAREHNDSLSLAGLDETFSVHLSWRDGRFDMQKDVTVTWGQIFSEVAPLLLQHPTDEAVQFILARGLYELKIGRTTLRISMDDRQFATIGIQLIGLGLVMRRYLAATSGGMALFWSLTEKGERMMLSLRSIKSTAQPDASQGEAGKE